MTVVAQMRIPWPVAKCAGLVMVALPLRFLPFPPELVGMLLAVAALLVPARPFHYALSGARYVCIVARPLFMHCLVPRHFCMHC